MEEVFGEQNFATTNLSLAVQRASVRILAQWHEC